MGNTARGKHALFISDRSGLAYPYTEMVKEWNGARVHTSEYEPKQPQLEPKPNGADGVSLLNTRTDRNEPPTAVALPKDPFTVTNGSSTLTVSLLNHNLQVGDFVLFFNGASNDPTESFNLGTNLFPLFAMVMDDGALVPLTETMLFRKEREKTDDDVILLLKNVSVCYVLK